MNNEPRYRIIIEPDGDGCFLASIPALKGCFACGDTPRDALETLLDIKATWLEQAKERGWRIPESEVYPLVFS